MEAPHYLPSHFMRLLWGAAALLVGGSAVSYVVAQATAGRRHGDLWDEIHQNLSVGVDLSLPTWFASMLWALFGLLAWYHAMSRPSHRSSWLVVAGVGWLASIDEYLMLHERLSGPASAIEGVIGVDLGGATWVLVGGLIALVVAALLGRLVISLPPPTRRDLMVGAGSFLLGALGFELVHNLVQEATGEFNWMVVLPTHIEEALEMVGLILAIRGLLRLLPAAS